MSLTPRSGADIHADLSEEERGLFFEPPLYSQRSQLVHNVLQCYGCRRIVDAGCSYGTLLFFVMNACSLRHVQLTHVTAIDLDAAALRVASQHLPFSGFSVAAYTDDCTLQCLQGDLTSSATIPAEWLPYPQTTSISTSAQTSTMAKVCMTKNGVVKGNSTVDAVISIEVIEHIPPHLVAAYTYTVFVELGAAHGARVVLLTTPNRDENTRLPRRASPANGPHRQQAMMSEDSKATEKILDASSSSEINSIYRPWEDAPRRRHDEHFFELTRQQWKRYVQYVELCYGRYWKAEEDVLLGDGFTQGTLFVAREDNSKEGLGTKVKSSSISSFAPPHKRSVKQSLSYHSDTTATSQGNCHDCTVMSRDAAIAAFPFWDIFGMSFADYAEHFLISANSSCQESGDAKRPLSASKTTPSRSCAAMRTAVKLCESNSVPYTRLEHRVIEGIALWDRFCDVVHRCYINLIQPIDHSASRFLFGGNGTTMKKGNTPVITFLELYTKYIAPSLYVLLEACTVPLVLRTLFEQRASRLKAIKEDVARWRRFVRDAHRHPRHPLLRAGHLREHAAHVPQGYRAVLDGGVPFALSFTRAAPVMLLPSCAHQTFDVCSCAVPLFPLPSEASTLLSRSSQEAAGGDGSLHRCCAEGMSLLERGFADSTGLLLTDWLCSEVARCGAGFSDITHQEKAPVSQRRGKSAWSAPPSTLTMKHLPEHLLQLLFFMVSVCVIPDVYAALCSGWGSRERHFVALFRDVHSAMPAVSSPNANSLSATAKGSRGPAREFRGRRRRAIQPEKTCFPHWLSRLLQTTISLTARDDR